MEFNTATITAVVFALCSCSSRGQRYGNNNDAGLIGAECSPPFGYLRNTCGDELLIEEIVEESPDYIYGPNTCRITTRSQRNELDYTFQEYCSWYFNYHYYNYVWQCQAVCLPTSTCSNRNQTIERSTFECCPGYQVRPADSPSHYEYIFKLYYTQVAVAPVGCPRVVGLNVLDCLEVLGLTEYLAVIDDSEFMQTLLNNTGFEFTLFAPTNAAFENMLEAVGGNPDLLVGHHLVEGVVKVSDLVYDQRFMSYFNTTLHSTTVVYGTRTLYQYNYQHAKDHSNSMITYTNIQFVGGARVTEPDVCVSDGVTLHVIDRVLVPSLETIASILESQSNFTRFLRALDIARVLDFLDKEDGVSRTLFVPTDAVFDAQIPEDLFDCLMYKRYPLNDLVLYHVSRGAEYTPSLSLREFTYTLNIPNVIRLTTNANGSITFLTTPPSTIVVENIPASNGVIHVIDGVLFPPNLDYNECEEFVPTTPPPTTAPPTTDPPTTDPATESTTAESTTSADIGDSEAVAPSLIDLVNNP